MKATKLKFLMALMTFFCACSSNDNIDSEVETAPDLAAWLADNPAVADALRLESANVGPSYQGNGSLVEVSYDDWSDEDKAALSNAFQRAWVNIHQNRFVGNLGEQEFTMPMACSNCAADAAADPNGFIVHYVPEAVGKSAAFAYMGHSLAIEINESLSWSIANLSSDELYFFLNSRSVVHRRGLGTTDFVAGGRKGVDPQRTMGSGSPATPVFAYDFLISNNLLASTHEETIHNVLEWFRDNAIHFYGAFQWQNAHDHWGSYGMTPAHAVAQGTIRDTESEVQHWTAGCHGTNSFLKLVLKAVNIPVEIYYICSHSVAYFPSINRYMDHGDNPYNATVKNNPSKDISGILIDEATFNARFGPSAHGTENGTSACTTMINDIGRAAAEF